MSERILHIVNRNPISIGYMKFIAEQFDVSNHLFLSKGEHNKITEEVPFRYINKRGLAWLIKFIGEAHRAEKIILHSLTYPWPTVPLFFLPWLAKKCYWVIWGADLYAHQVSENTLGWRISEFFRREVIKKIAFLVTYIEGDVELARKWYGARGKYIECLMYPSNTYSPINSQPESPDKSRLKDKKTIKLLVGNSATQSNNHIEIFEKLKSLDNQNFEIICPLSYGSPEYANQIAEIGKDIFGSKFFPLLQILPLADYNRLLSEVDIAIFAHNRQQAMGNIINLLGSGKKVYMKSEITPWRLFSERGIKVFNTNFLNLNPISNTDSVINKTKIKQKFSIEILIGQWEKIFKGTL